MTFIFYLQEKVSFFFILGVMGGVSHTGNYGNNGSNGNNGNNGRCEPHGQLWE